MEAMKLVASGKFAEKRIGYLALMILLDETTKVRHITARGSTLWRANG